MESIFLKTNDLHKLALEADEVLVSNDKERIRQLLDSFLNCEFTFESDLIEAYFLYISGNLSQNIYNYNRVDWYSDELSRSVILFRKALFTLKKIKLLDKSSRALQSLIETNLGNTLCSQGRTFCCIPLWDSALKEKSNAVPIISKATHLVNLAYTIENDNHKAYYYFTAYKLIQLGLQHLDLLVCDQKNAYAEHSKLIDFKKWFEKNHKTDDFDDIELFEEKCETRKQKAYLKWCGDNKLFINELNDICTSEYVYLDSLGLPSYSFTINETLSMYHDLMYHGNFDELKNDYCYARYLFFSAKDIPNESPHFFNDTYSHVNDMSYSLTNLKASHYKSAFRTIYSIFDKIAYFLNRFFDLKASTHDSGINFDSIFKKNSGKKSGNKPWEPNPKLKEMNNTFIQALFYILKDIRDVKDSANVSCWIDPDIESFCTIRNAIEHRSLKIVDDYSYSLINSDLNYRTSKIDELKKIDSLEAKSKLTEHEKLSTHSILISVSDFESRLMSLMRLSRNSIMYLSFAIQMEEQKKEFDDALIATREIPFKRKSELF